MTVIVLWRNSVDVKQTISSNKKCFGRKFHDSRYIDNYFEMCIDIYRYPANQWQPMSRRFAGVLLFVEIELRQFWCRNITKHVREWWVLQGGALLLSLRWWKNWSNTPIIDHNRNNTKVFRNSTAKMLCGHSAFSLIFKHSTLYLTFICS